MEIHSETPRYKLFYIKANASDDELETQVLVCQILLIYIYFLIIIFRC